MRPSIILQRLKRSMNCRSPALVLKCSATRQSLGCQSGLYLVYNGRKSGWIVDRHFGELLSIQADVSFVQPMDELAVTQAMKLAGSANSNDPQLAKFTPLGSAISERKHASSYQCLFSGSKELASSANITFSSLQQSLLGLRASGAFSCSHGENPLICVPQVIIDSCCISRGLCGPNNDDVEPR